ncbi:MAG TPA: hypothetical protein VK976_15200 [Verrucomicrobiae bacterium]|nr:hypothetical protein [Verrucomicrobiae bacterium]
MELSKPLGRKGPAKVPVDRLSSNSVATHNNYETNLKIARALGGVFGFKVRAFWQPAVIYKHKALAPYERLLLRLGSGLRYPFLALVPVYKDAETRAAENGDFVFLADAFDSVREPVYLDWGHLNPIGNEIIARTMTPYFHKCLK